MSRTIKGSKPQGYDFWSRRPHSQCGSGVVAKKHTTRTERQQGKKEALRELS